VDILRRGKCRRDRGMNVVVVSGDRARAYEPAGSEICISITNPEADPVALSAQFRAVLRLAFSDIAGPSPFAWDRLFSSDDARRTLEFIGAHSDADTLVVHCTAGESRSPAVALALTELWGLTCADLEERYPLWNTWVRSELLRTGGVTA
jgi:predicted protein tyrosine phosphatase